MKSYEEMAQSVITRARDHRAAVKRRTITLTAGALCLCVVGLVFTINAGPGEQNPVLQVTQPKATTTPNASVPPEESLEPHPSYRVTLLHSTADSEAVKMEEQVQLPYRTLIRLRDISGVAEEQMSTVYAQEEEYLDQLFACYSKEAINSWERYRGENVLITTASVGQFVFRVDDFSAVESLRVSVTEVGRMGLMPRLDDYCSIALRSLSIELDEAGIEEAYQSEQGGIIMSWGLSPSTATLLKNDTGMPLSSLRDTITYTVTFKDGSVETHLVDMTINDNGEVYATYRGISSLA